MKTILLTFLTIFITITSFGQVNFTTGKLTIEEVSMYLMTSKHDFWLKVELKSQKNYLDLSPEMLIRFSNGDTVHVEGELIDGIFIGTRRVTEGEEMKEYTLFRSYAEFYIRPDQLDKFKHGMAKIRISTSPEIITYSFRKDTYGKKIYNLFYEKYYRKFDEDF